MKASSRFLSFFLVLALMLGCSSRTDRTDTAAGEGLTDEAAMEVFSNEAAGEVLPNEMDSTPGLFLALMERSSESLAFPLSEEQTARVE